MGLVDFSKGRVADDLAKKKSRELSEAAASKTPRMRQHDYAVARESILGMLSCDPLSACHECVTRPKVARRKDRLDLATRTVLASPEHAAVAARLRKYLDEVEYMRCAKHVYLTNDPNAPPYLRDNPPPGFTKATPAQLKVMGVEEDMLTPPGSNFRAAVYMKDPAVWGRNPQPAAILAFRGSTPAEEDWSNNFAQDANRESDYYRRAVTIGNALALKGASVHIVGHSLGGGLASAAQGGSGLTASTYNAAGLHPATVKNYSTDRRHMAAEPGKITAFRVKGELLTKIQEDPIGSKGLSSVANDAVGIKQELLPSHTQHYLNTQISAGTVSCDEKYDSYLHGMDEVIDSTEQQKRKDEAVLKQFIVHQRRVCNEKSRYPLYGN